MGVTIVAACALAMAAAPLAATTSSAATPGWSASYTSTFDQPASKEKPSLLTSVASFGPKSALAVGFTYNEEEDGVYAPVIKHWNGTAWATWAHQPKIKNLEKNGFQIFDVAGTSTSNVWLITSGNSDHVGNPGILHWNGSTWKTLTQAGLPPRWTGSVQVSASHIWLTGTDVTGVFYDRPLIATYSTRSGPHHWVATRYAGSGSFEGAIIRSAKDAWAVGTTAALPSGSGQPLIEHWTGSAWHRTPTPPVTGDLSAIYATSATDALAVGTDTTVSPSKPIAFHWNGTTWTQTAAPIPDGTYNAVTGDSASDYWVAGSDPADPTHVVYSHYVDGVWTTVVGPARDFTGASGQYSTIEVMVHIAGSSSDWAVGFHAPNDCNGDDDCANNVAGAQIIDRNNQGTAT